MRRLLSSCLCLALAHSGCVDEDRVGFCKPFLFGGGLDPRNGTPLVGDFDGDRFADAATVRKQAIEVAFSAQGQKLREPVLGTEDLGGGVVACAAGRLRDARNAEIALLFANGRIRIASWSGNGRMSLSESVATVGSPDRSSLLLGDFDGDGRTDLLIARPTGRWTVVSQRGRDFATSTGRGGTSPRAVLRGPRSGRRDGILWLDSAGNLARAHWDGANWTSRRLETGVDPTLNPVSGDFDGDGQPDLLLGDRLWWSCNPLTATVVSVDAKSPLLAADATGDGLDDLFCFQKGETRLQVAYRKGSVDSDADGLSDEEELALQTDPYDRDTDQDGLLDGWEVHGAFGYPFPAEGFSPRRKDVLCLLQQKAEAHRSRVRGTLPDLIESYASLPVRNPDPEARGIGLHFRELEELPRSADDRGWAPLGKENLPLEWIGLAHYVVVRSGQGGQSMTLGEKGQCGDKTFAMTFIHEFGHQLGLDHTGRFEPEWCPIYRSVMNYAYEQRGVGYSTGSLASAVMTETSLEERLPFPIEQVRFLADAPHRFRLQAAGDTTLVDWNRNGVFDREPVSADVTTGASTRLPDKQTLGKTMFAPAFAAEGDQAWLFSVNPRGILESRRYLGDSRWSDPVNLGASEAIGDPMAVGFGGNIYCFVPRPYGVVWYAGPSGDRLRLQGIVPNSAGLEVAVAVYRGALLALLWSKESGAIWVLEFSGPSWRSRGRLPLLSGIPPGAVEDPITGELIVGVSTRDRWETVRLVPDGEGRFLERERRRVGGDEEAPTGDKGCRLVFEPGRGAGPQGRIHFIAPGHWRGGEGTDGLYDLMTIDDREHDGGWLRKRYGSEWASTQSPAAAAWYGDDILLAYRNREDDDLIGSHRGLGISAEPMSDFDDVSFIADVGLAHSIAWMAAPR